MIKKLFYFSLFFLFLMSKQVAAQKATLFFEKVFLHTDRSAYAGGDNIWFKAYLINPRGDTLTNSSNTLYVNLFNPEKTLIQSIIVRLENGIGNGDFKLKDSIMPGNYVIRAYTNWMKNFDNHFFFEKTIPIVAITGQKVDNNPPSNMPSIQFFPEGGTLIADIKGKLAFKALDVNGKSIEAEGFILSEKKDTAATFKTNFGGMGFCDFIPKQDIDYTAVITFKNGKKVTQDLPTVYATGYGLHITPLDTNYIISIQTNATTLANATSKAIVLVARHAGKIIYKEQYSLSNKPLEVSIGKSVFPNGISAITLYDEKLTPYSERLIYVDHPDQNVQVQIKTDKPTYLPKEKINIEITTTNQKQEPIAAQLSFAAVDNKSIKEMGSNLVAYFMLESELKGNIENPAYYFNTANKDRFKQLDLLLLTQGWRDFLWKLLADNNYAIKFLPESGITLAGNVSTKFGNKPMSNMNVTLVAPNAKGNKIYFTQTDQTGKYFLEGLPLYGTQSIKLSSKDDKGKRGGMLFLDSTEKASRLGFKNVLTPYAVDATYAKEIQKRWDVYQKNIQSDMTLQEVTVNAAVKPLTARDGTSESYMGYSFNAAITPEDKQYGTLINYLLHKTFATASIESETESVTFLINGKQVPPRFVVDKVEDVFNRTDYYQLPMDKINSVNIKQALGNNGGEMSDRIVITLNLKPGAFNNDLSLINTEIEGYSVPRVFYAPSYLTNSEKAKKDTRTTLFWEPLITTDAQGKAKLYFFNGDFKGPVNLQVQGVGTKGGFVFGEHKYTIE